MGRRSKDERKDDYLDIGAAIVAESALSGGADPGLALAHVKLADVAQRAGVTKGALYHLWPSQEAYWRDLLQHLLETNQLFGPERVSAMVEELHEAKEQHQSLRSYANDLFDDVRDDPAFFARISLYSYLDDELVRTSLDREFRVALDRLEPFLVRAITEMGRRPRSATAVRDVAVLIGALLEGLALKYRVDPDLTPDLPPCRGRRRTLFAAAAQAMLLACTEPVGEPGGPAAAATGAIDPAAAAGMAR